MEFALELDVAGLSWDEAQAIEEACRPADRWSVRALPRRRFVLPRRPALEVSTRHRDRELVTGDTDATAPFLPTDPELTPMLAETLLVISDILGRSFALTVAAPGEMVQHERFMDPEELATVVRASRIAPGTRYLVRPRVRRQFGRV